jgi:roadblock/LC7 domain-containing protein
MKISQIVMLAMLTGTTTLAQAAVVYSDNFESYGGVSKITWVPEGGWSYSGEGNVDLVLNGDYAINLAGGSNVFVDLNGTPGSPSFQRVLDGLTVGQSYNLMFDLAGNHRGFPNDSVTVNFGGSSNTFSVADSNADFSTFSLNFIATGSSANISFMDNFVEGNRNVGTLLDNVSVTAVPEPEVYGMMLMGLGLMGFVAQRRKNQEA